MTVNKNELNKSLVTNQLNGIHLMGEAKLDSFFKITIDRWENFVRDEIIC